MSIDCDGCRIMEAEVGHKYDESTISSTAIWPGFCARMHHFRLILNGL